MAIAREIRPDIVLLQGTWQLHLRQCRGDSHRAEATHRRARGRAGTGPFLRRGPASEVLRYYMLRHSLIPMRFTGDIAPGGYDAVMRDRLGAAGGGIHFGAGYNLQAEGCLTRPATDAADISTATRFIYHRHGVGVF